MGAGGVYARGRRPGLEVCMPIAGASVRGLRGVEPYVLWGFPRLPARFVERMIGTARHCPAPDFNTLPSSSLAASSKATAT